MEEEKIVTKIEKMQEFLDANNIKCFNVEKLEDEKHTTIFRSSMEVKGQILPMAVLMDDSIYVLLQVQIAPQVVDEEKLKALASAINNMNNNVRLFKFTVSERGDFMLNACITAENGSFNPALLSALMTETLRFMEAQYSNIMELLWKK
ncbi:histidine kinase [Phascolarctobacterium sp.]|uniref:histidine kinase n=1 Tax=Phascolarctobacterium sp. TaxID=2049039 RepID=UPI003863FD5D